MIRAQQAIKRTETPEDLTGTLAFLTSDGGWDKNTRLPRCAALSH